MRANRVLKMAVACTLASASVMAWAQNAPTAGTTTELETVVVTGSYIKGTAEDAALPVDVITTEDLAKQGSPSMVDLIKSIPSVQGVIGESNQFLVNQSAGSGNVNLRGLGAQRTLVLLNGRRLTGATTGNGVDTNLLPTAAIGRIEVLKDGAAATYGSDAIGGVVNFITKEKFTGFSIDGNYSAIEGSNGDYGMNLAWGWRGDASNALLAAGYRHRSELSTKKRNWAVRSLTDNPEGGWSGFSGPGTYFTPSFGTRVVDPACTALGGAATGTPAAPGCSFQYIVYDNLVEKEDHYQVYGEYNLNITDTTSFHSEALWAMHDVPEEHVSPSYGPNQNVQQLGGLPSTAAGSSTAPIYFIPVANPGLTSLLPSLTPAQQTAINTAGGLVGYGLTWRPLAQGGNPATGGAQLNERKFDAFRVSAGFKGEFSGGISWDTAATYSQNTSKISTPDFVVSYLGLALRGFGGPNCNGIRAGLAGSTCHWLNPFSTAVPTNMATGAVNNVTYVPGQTVDADVVRWVTTDNSYEDKSSVLAVDAVLSGKLGLSLWGGDIGWAGGAQFRQNKYQRVVTDVLADITQTPCPSSPVNSAATCSSSSGALSFYGPTTPSNVSQDVKAVFAEFNLPILDSLNAQLAVRYEDYGGAVGSTTNPKLSLRYQPIDWLTFRGSAGTTFRAPPQTSLAPGSLTTLAYTPQAGGYKPYDTSGNPNLKPETADTFNVGIIVKAGGFNGSVDYWHFKFKDALTAEVGTQLVTAMFTSYVDSLGVTQANHCADPAYSGLLTRFTFTSTCSAANLLRTAANQINAQEPVTISGVDANLSYLFDGVFGSDIMLGADGTYNFEYKVGANTVEGIQIDAAADLIGTRGGRGGSLPQWKGSAYVDVSSGIHNVRWTTRYVAGVDDVRVATFATNTNAIHVGSFMTHDLTYLVKLPAETTVSISVLNIANTDPSFARLDLSYDPFIGNPLGRVVKVAASKKF